MGPARFSQDDGKWFILLVRKARRALGIRPLNRGALHQTDWLGSPSTLATDILCVESGTTGKAEFGAEKTPLLGLFGARYIFSCLLEV